MKRLFIKTHYLEAERESFFFDLRALLEGAFGKEWKNIWLFCLMFCFSPHCRMDGRSKTFRPGERLVPLGTCGTNLQQTCTTEEPEGGTTCEECQAAGLLQEIRLYFVWTCTVSLPWGNHLFSIVPQKKHLCKEHNTALWQNWVLFAKESGNSIRKNHSLPVCHQDYGSSRRKKVACIACFVVIGRDFTRTEVWDLDFRKYIPGFATDKLQDLGQVTSEFCLSFPICEMGVNLPTSLDVVRLNSLVLAY